MPAGRINPEADEQPETRSPSASPTEQQHKVQLQNKRVADLDIFADDVAEVLDQAKAAAAAVRPSGGADPALQDNYDDAEGYYNFQVGQHVPADRFGPGLPVSGC